MKRLALIDNYDSFTYNLAQLIEVVSGEPITIFRNDEVTIRQLKSFDVIFLSPGPGLPKDAGKLLTVIAHFANHKPIFGVCLGFQAIAVYFGARLKNLKTVYHGKATPVQVTDETEVLFKSIPKSFLVGRYHSWVVNRTLLPKCLKILAVDAAENNIMAMRHHILSIAGVQFHPESVLTQYGMELISNFLSMYPNSS